MHLVEHINTAWEMVTRVILPLGGPPDVIDHASPTILSGCVVKVSELRAVNKCVATQWQINRPVRNRSGPAEVENECEDHERRGEEQRPPGQLHNPRLGRFCHDVPEKRQNILGLMQNVFCYVSRVKGRYADGKAVRFSSTSGVLFEETEE
jgi:hypothetical protein